MPDLNKTKLMVIAGCVATLIPIIQFFEIPIPKLAWGSELQNLEKGQLEMALDLYRRELSRQRYENLKLQREQRKIEEVEGTIPDNYLKEQEYLESDIREIGQTLKEAHSRLLELK